MSLLFRCSFLVLLSVDVKQIVCLGQHAFHSEERKCFKANPANLVENGKRTEDPMPVSSVKKSNLVRKLSCLKRQVSQH